MTTRIYLIIFLLFSVTNYSSSFASQSIEETNDSLPLFASNEPLKFTLIIDTKALKKDNDKEPEYSEGQLILHSDAEDENFDIKVRPRGNSRRFFDFCIFPPIKLNFKKKAVDGTVFEGQDKIKLVAFCKDLDINEAYVLKEYLVYKLLNCLTPYSNKVRLAEITYKDINNKGKEINRYGFLIEDDDDMAERNNGTITEVLMSNHDRCERNSLDLFTVFQFMIGNTDWWIARPMQHNVNVVLLENGTMIPVPYDFDYCGFVDAKYAVPPEILEIENVRERLFRGYCRLPGTYERVVEKFNQHKDEMYREINDFDQLNERYRKVAVKYLDAFYKIVNDPKLIKRNIYDKCEIDHTHLHKTKKNK